MEKFEVVKIKLRRYKIYKYKISEQMFFELGGDFKINAKTRKLTYANERPVIDIINATFGLNRVVTGLVIS